MKLELFRRATYLVACFVIGAFSYYLTVAFENERILARNLAQSERMVQLKHGELLQTKADLAACERLLIAEERRVP